jgi:hypothetical protein
MQVGIQELCIIRSQDRKRLDRSTWSDFIEDNFISSTPKPFPQETKFIGCKNHTLNLCLIPQLQHILVLKTNKLWLNGWNFFDFPCGDDEDILSILFFFKFKDWSFPNEIWLKQFGPRKQGGLINPTTENFTAGSLIRSCHMHTGTYKYFQIFLLKKQVNHIWFRVQTSVVRVNGLGFALSVNLIMKFIYTPCNCKCVIFICIGVSVNVEYKTCKCINLFCAV